MPCPQGRVGSNPTSGMGAPIENRLGRGMNQHFWSLRTAIAVQTGQNSREIWRLARRQHYVLTRDQLRAFGITPSGISHRLRTGRLRRLHRGVFLVGNHDNDWPGRWMAAVLACGPEALLSHASAAALWQIRP